MTRGASIGGVRISQGTLTGKGSLFDGELRKSNQGNHVIFHIRYLGVKPDSAQSLDAKGLDQLGQSLDSFVRQ